MSRRQKKHRKTIPVRDLLARAYQLLQEQAWPEAAAILRRVLEAQPHNWAAMFLVGVMAGLRGHYDIALEHLTLAIDLHPGPWPEGLNNLGVVYWRMNRTEAAIRTFQQALVHAPDRIDCWVNLGNALHDVGRDDEALAAFAKAGAISPSHPSPRFNRSFIQIRRGDYRNGWRNYECRWLLQEWLMEHARDFPGAERWWGRPFPDQTLLVHWEQGFGDTIQFARYLPWVRSQGSRVIFEVQQALLPLFVGAADHVVGHGDPLPPFDLYVPLLSLPHLHGTTLETIPPPYPLAA